jgi:hypothetical protein
MVDTDHELSGKVGHQATRRETRARAGRREKQTFGQVEQVNGLAASSATDRSRLTSGSEIFISSVAQCLAPRLLGPEWRALQSSKWKR